MLSALLLGKIGEQYRAPLMLSLQKETRENTSHLLNTKLSLKRK